MRDDFSAAVKRMLASRVQFVCSNPTCSAPTIGPNSTSGSANIGVAAHISAASPNGPRYNPCLTPQERKSIDNGIWLCQSCARLIDVDPAGYGEEILRQWKLDSEKYAKRRLGRQPSSCFQHEGYSNNKLYTAISKKHLYIEHASNYSHLYLNNCSESLSQIEDEIVILNTSDKPLTHFRIHAYLYADRSNLNLFNHYYDLNIRHYIRLGTFELGVLGISEKSVIRLCEIAQRMISGNIISAEDLNRDLFPAIGEYQYRRLWLPNEKERQLFTQNSELLKKYMTITANKNCNALGGMPIKLVLSYQYDAYTLKSILIGGMYYFSHYDGEKFLPLPFAVGNFIQPRYSLLRSTQDGIEKVVDYECELHYRKIYIPSIQGRYSLHAVHEHDPHGKLDKLLTIDFDNAFVSNKFDEAYKKMQERKFIKAINVLTRLSLIDPGQVGVFMNRGICYYELGNTNDALKDFQRAAELGNEAGINFAKSNGFYA